MARLINLLVLACFCTGAIAQSVANVPLPESLQSTIGYRSVAEAARALRTKSGVETSIENGWTIVVDEPAFTIWSFAPQSDPSYPSVVKRTFIEQKGGTQMLMAVQCEASKGACDNLVRQFQELNNAARDSLQNRR